MFLSNSGFSETHYKTYNGRYPEESLQPPKSNGNPDFLATTFESLNVMLKPKLATTETSTHAKYIQTMKVSHDSIDLYQSSDSASVVTRKPINHNIEAISENQDIFESNETLQSKDFFVAVLKYK